MKVMRLYHYIYIILTMLCTTFTACQDHFDINQLKEGEKLIVYCFPSAKDSTDIQVSATIPLDGASAILPKDVEVNCFVNGEKQAVRYLRNDDTDEWDKLIFRLSTIPKEGEEVKVEVSTEGYPTVVSTSVIPATPKIDSITTREIQIDGELYTQLCVKMQDNPKVQDFYAVRVFSKWDGNYWEKREINLYAEPVLNYNIMGIPTLDEDIDYHDNFYIFDDSSFSNDSTYTLHLNLKGKRGYYLVQLYHLSYPLYAFLRSINDASNNELGKYGLSFTRPTYSNVNSGIGAVGGYGLEEKIFKYIEKSEE